MSGLGELMSGRSIPSATMAMEQTQKAYAESLPRNPTRRERLEFQRQRLSAELTAVEKAIAALDAHPELEDFIETLARAGA